MVREIICLQIGQCGNGVANSLWDLILKEHQLTNDGIFTPTNKKHEDMECTAKIGKYFIENKQISNKYTLRTIPIDLNPSTMDILKSSSIRGIFDNNNMISGSNGTNNNFAKGYYTNGNELYNDVIENIINSVTEKCDNIDGFQIFNSLGGGTGSGLTSLIVDKLNSNYKKNIKCLFSIYPTITATSAAFNVYNIYNSVLSLKELMDSCDLNFVINYDSLYSITKNVLKISDPSYNDFNSCLSLLLSDITHSFRYPHALYNNMNTFCIDMTPFKRLKFLSATKSPLFNINKINRNKLKLTVQELVNQMWGGRSSFSRIKFEDGKIMFATSYYRGPMSSEELIDEDAKVLQKFADDFLTYIPNNLQSAWSYRSSYYYQFSCCLITNTTAIKTVFQDLNFKFDKLYKRKQFLHLYKQEGMDELEFEESYKNLNKLIHEYQDINDMVIDLDDDDDDDDDDYDDTDDDDDDDDDDF